MSAVRRTKKQVLWDKPALYKESRLAFGRARVLQLGRRFGAGTEAARGRQPVQECSAAKEPAKEASKKKNTSARTQNKGE